MWLAIAVITFVLVGEALEGISGINVPVWYSIYMVYGGFVFGIWSARRDTKRL